MNYFLLHALRYLRRRPEAAQVPELPGLTPRRPAAQELKAARAGAKTLLYVDPVDPWVSYGPDYDELYGPRAKGMLVRWNRLKHRDVIVPYPGGGENYRWMKGEVCGPLAPQAD